MATDPGAPIAYPSSEKPRVMTSVSCDDPPAKVGKGESFAEEDVDHKGGKLPNINMMQLAGITYFSACGGPFGFEEAIGAGGGSAALLGTFLVPLVWSIPQALMTAELSTMIPASGGHIVWINEALGPFFGSLNCVLAFFTNCFDNALYPVMFVDYLEEAVWAYRKQDFSEELSFALRAVVIAFCCLLNIKGADIVGDASLMFGLFVLSPFVVMMIMGMGPVLEDLDGLPGTHVDPKGTDYRWGTFASVMLWNTGGFDNSGTCASEVANPGKMYPRALTIAIVLVILTYAGPTLVGIYFIPEMDDWEDGVFVDVGQLVGGSWLSSWMGAAGVASSLCVLCTMLCTTSRMLSGMAATGNLPAAVGALHSKYGTPYIAVILNGVITLGLSVFSFTALAEVDMLFYNISTVLKFVALIYFRYTRPQEDRPYRIPLGNIRVSSWNAHCTAPSQWLEMRLNKSSAAAELTPGNMARGMAMVCFAFSQGLILYFLLPTSICIGTVALFNWRSILILCAVIVVFTCGYAVRRFIDPTPSRTPTVTGHLKAKRSDPCFGEEEMSLLQTGQKA